MLLGRLSSTALCWRLSLRHPRRLSEPAAPELRAFIAGNTEPVRDHLTPEVCLRLLTPRCRFWSQPAHLWPFSDPYWAIYWPGGQALSRYLLDNPAVTRSKRVLDVGSGCGASAIAASMSGASHVLANDIDPIAAVSIGMNCELNQIPLLLVAIQSLIGEMEEKWDVILLGDMFYDEELAANLHNWLTEYKKFHGSEILIGDPGRSQFTNYAAQHCLQKVIEYELPDSTRQQNYGLTSSSVWRFLL
ncbi:electron transfer flavoprotein beta subunit lysine methyltransferase isoform X1 [Stegostoma tigrinum]|uniref:electron transfer flavoprotein beta subunit lysine methyltransferase isoform X1 n=1 Tax=Stegostoma tigrinum TaxID=3053191 RepID=UPI00286FB765|nr:electron transfer flavoprotein beta subunit lysine methyltransferase isoform X1 [Stegostoma tigrinum]